MSILNIKGRPHVLPKLLHHRWSECPTSCHWPLVQIQGHRRFISTSNIYFKKESEKRNSTSNASTVKYHFSMPHIVDDKSPHVIPFIIQCYEKHRGNSESPFFIGLNGVQGIGKSTLVESLSATLRSSPYSLNTLTLSIDDFYLPFAELQSLASANPANPLLQQRGQPGTHDTQLALQVFRELKSRQRDVRIPGYDKSANGGRGDRKPESGWSVVNASSESDDKGTVDVVIFEGWCVGFRALQQDYLERKWREAREDLLSKSSQSKEQIEAALDDVSKPLTNNDDDAFSGRLGALALSSVAYVNDALASQGYEELFTQYLDAFVYLDAEDPFYVYKWRGQQEDELREQKGKGSAMSNKQVKKFVDGYFPAYEVYVDRVRAGVFADMDGERAKADKEGAQMRLLIAEDRSVLRSEVV